MFLWLTNGGTLRGLKGADIDLTLQASLEGTLLLKHLGYPVLDSDIAAYTSGRRKMKLFYWVCIHTKIGELAASNHANKAVGEMILLNKAFDKLIAQAPDFEMKVWKRLETFIPRG